MIAASPPLARDGCNGKRTVGVLALQGAFEEHEASFQQLPDDLLQCFKLIQVRKGEELDVCDALVIPGGESTTMKIIARCDKFMEYLRAFVHGGFGSDGVQRQPRPVWGTCAGCILLSDDVVNQLPGPNQEEAPQPKRCKYGEPIGGLAVSTCRNFFGRQSESFEATVVAADSSNGDTSAQHRAFADFPAVFIRAPAILRAGAGVRALARVRHPNASAEAAGEGVIVAVESRHILATCFHPELAQDSRIHRYFVERFVLGTSPDPVLDSSTSAGVTAV